jgi:hypothetical protein
MKFVRALPAIAALVVPAAVQAEPSTAEKSAAREMARLGAVYFDNGEWERAREHFRRAYDIVGAPTLALMEARSLVELGSLVEAEDAYARAASLPADPNNAPYRKAQADANKELAALRPRVPVLRITLARREPAAEVRVDGMPRADFASISLNPGTHLVSVVRAGAPESWRSVTLVEGERRTVAFDVPAAPPSSRSDALMWTAFGLGAAGITTGVVTGALALDRKTTLDRACNGTTCPPAAESDLSAYRTFRTVSFIGYAAGLVGVGGGVALLLTRRKEPETSKLQASVSPSPSGFVLSGSF